MARPDGYDKPIKTQTTPPAIDPDVKPRTFQEMKADGESEGEVLGHRSDPDEIDTELSETMKKRQARDGLGENGHDSAKPETLLPPD